MADNPKPDKPVAVVHNPDGSVTTSFDDDSGRSTTYPDGSTRVFLDSAPPVKVTGNDVGTWLTAPFTQELSDALRRKKPGPKRKVGKALVRYDALVKDGGSTDRDHHYIIKQKACDGVCTVRALEMALEARKTK
jgi:hypothetical protein